MGSSSSGSAANSAGTHVAGSGPVTMALSQFQTEMSRINLLRVRGEFSAAKASCLVLLKSFPQSVEAHLMMGDIHSELTEFPQAIEWYSLANDLDKSSSAAQNKLKRAQSALDRMQNPKDSKLISSSVALAVVAGIAAIAIGAIAFLAGSTSSGNRTDTIVQRVVAPKNEGESKSPTAVTTPPPAVRIEIVLPLILMLQKLAEVWTSLKITWMQDLWSLLEIGSCLNKLVVGPNLPSILSILKRTRGITH